MTAQPKASSSRHSNRTANEVNPILDFHKLEQKLAPLDFTNLLSIGVNRVVQCPQDLVLNYSEGCQTEIVMVHDVETDTSKICLDSCIQSDNNTLDISTQTVKNFVKNKGLQTDGFKANAMMQTIKPKVNSAGNQTNKELHDKFVETLPILERKVDSECDRSNKETQTEVSEEREKSDSPPLSAENPSSSAQVPFSLALFIPLAARLPTVGT